MNIEELKEILEKHKKWLNDEDGGEQANLREADLRGANLYGADLSGADLSGADHDYSCWPLWCGSLTAGVDDRTAIQLLYHTLSVVQHSPYVSNELKRTLLVQPVVDAANRFHHAKECGNLSVYTESDGECE